MKNIFALFLVLLICGCATYQPIPEGYSGPVSVITDTYTNKQATTAHYFTLQKIDGNNVKNSFVKTRQDNYGRGMDFTPSMVSREVLPVQQEIEISAYIFFPTDAQALFRDSMSVVKKILLKPQAGEEYFVKGEILNAGSQVWLEDSQGNRIE